MTIEMIRASHPGHHQQVAVLHAAGITEGFLSTLGTPFLSRLYMGIDRATSSRLILAGDGDEVLGFISFAEDVGSCYREVLRRDWFRLGLALLPSLLKPGVYRKIFDTLRYPSKSGHTESGHTTEKASGNRPELLSMAVSEKARGRGIGKLLVAALEEEFTRAGVTGYFVVTYAVDTRSNGFYSGRGFKKVGSFSSHRKAMNEYFKEIESGV